VKSQQQIFVELLHSKSQNDQNEFNFSIYILPKEAKTHTAETMRIKQGDRREGRKKCVNKGQENNWRGHSG